MPSTFSIRKRQPTVDKKTFYVSYFYTTEVAKPFEPSLEPPAEETDTADFVVLDIAIRAYRASQARRTAQYLLPVVSDETGVEIGLLNISVEPVDARVSDLLKRTEQLMVERKKRLTPKEVPNAEGNNQPDPGPESDPDKPGSPERDAPGNRAPE